MTTVSQTVSLPVIRYLLLLLATIPAAAQDVFVPPVPAGIARDGKIRTPNGPIPFPAEKTEWIRVRSPRFDVISSADASRTRDIVGDLDTLGTALERANPSRPAQTPATVFIFGNRRESQPYFDLLFAKENARATGAYVRHDGGGTMFIDGSRRGRFERTAMHDLVHDLLRRNGVAPPLWLEEGLAEYFGNADVRNGRVTAGEPIPQHVTLIRQKPLMSIEQLLAVQSEADAASSSIFYAQSWAAVDWLMSLDAEKFFPFLRDVASGTPLADALQTHYKQTIRDLDVAIRRRDNSTLVAVLKSIAPPASEPEPLPRATLLYELGSFLTHVAGAENEAQRHFAEALRVDPKHARTLAAIQRFDEAVAAAPSDPHVHLLYAESLLETALGDFAGVFTATDADTPRFRKARALAEHALTVGGDEARARGILGTTYFVETDLTPGIAQLEQALALAPQRVDFALNLYAMYLRTGAREKADALYATHFEHAREKQTIFAARNVLVTAETERANALAQSGKLSEAAAIVRMLAANTADPAGRRELERQAAQLESTDAVNREITAYNDAIALTNKGKNREALKLLDELLKTATDAEVIRDATALRNELRKMRR
jgi:tetratricopeptide (TPR) repeat protein